MKRLFGITLAALAFLFLAGIMIVSAEGEEQPDVIIAGMPPHPSLLSKYQAVVDSVNADYQSVRSILVNSCFDCHSDSTSMPWYHSMPLIKGLIDGHIKEGKEHLDLSHDFPFKGQAQPAKLLAEIREEIEEGEMPLCSYRLLHWGKQIEGDDRDSLFAWIDRSLSALDTVRINSLPISDDDDDHDHDDD